MEGKLIKVENGYLLIDVNTSNEDRWSVIGSYPFNKDVEKLSLKNCEAIENGYDLDELAENNYPTFNLPLTDTTAINTLKQDSFKEGFQKALEILGDKKFSEEDVKNVYLNSFKHEWFGDCIKSLQQTEWDVIVEMECVMGCQNLILNGENSVCCGDKKPKLDAENCLILKRK